MRYDREYFFRSIPPQSTLVPSVKSLIMSRCIDFLPRKGVRWREQLILFIRELYFLSFFHLRPALVALSGKNERAFRCVTLTVAGALHELHPVYFHRASFCFIRLPFFHYPFRYARAHVFQRNVGRTLQKTKMMGKSEDSKRVW